MLGQAALVYPERPGSIPKLAVVFGSCGRRQGVYIYIHYIYVYIYSSFALDDVNEVGV